VIFSRDTKLLAFAIFLLADSSSTNGDLHDDNNVKFLMSNVQADLQ